MPTKKQIITIGVLCVIALGLGYWSGMPEKGSGQRAEVVAPTVVTNVVTNVLKEVVTNIVVAPQPTPTPSPAPFKKPPNTVPANTFNPTIEKAIRLATFTPEGEIANTDLEKVRGLNLGNKRLADVMSLEKLTQLMGLNLSKNQLAKAPKGLENLTQLTRLNLSNNQLTNMKGLEKLTELIELNLSNNQLTNMKGLEKLTKLSELNLGYNQLSTIPNELNTNNRLTKLNLDGNELTNVKGLNNLTHLKIIHLDFNNLTDISDLKKFTKLEELWLKDNPALTKAQIAELQKALPNCRISSNPTK